MRINHLKLFIFFTLFFLLFPFQSIFSNNENAEKTNIFKAVVVSVKSNEEKINEYSGLVENFQIIDALITSGEKKGVQVEISNDYIPLSVGDKFFAQLNTSNDGGDEIYTVAEPDRTNALLGFLILFLAVLFLFGGMQGIRGLASLIGSLFLIVYALIPGILGGYSPILVALLVSAVIIVLGSFITHGFNKTTLSAVYGMVATVIFTGALASFAVNITKLTGLSEEESVFLIWNTGNNINMIGLLLGGILIGLLGVLYDVAIGQAVSVEELIRANSKMSKKDLYKRASRIGHEHIGALVNTLAIAYVGASLPLLLLVSGNNDESLLFTLNREIFATEIIRTLVGSIGLILAVPITTLIAVFVLSKVKNLKPSHVHTHTHHHNHVDEN